MINGNFKTMQDVMNKIIVAKNNVVDTGAAGEFTPPPNSSRVSSYPKKHPQAAFI